LIDPVIYEPFTFDSWFEADVPRVFANMTDRHSNHYRTKVHPLFSLTGFLPVYLIKKVFHVEAIVAVKGFSSVMQPFDSGVVFRSETIRLPAA
jgi:hypothetical protein